MLSEVFGTCRIYHLVFGEAFGTCRTYHLALNEAFDTCRTGHLMLSETFDACRTGYLMHNGLFAAEQIITEKLLGKFVCRNQQLCGTCSLKYGLCA